MVWTRHRSFLAFRWIGPLPPDVPLLRVDPLSSLSLVLLLLLLLPLRSSYPRWHDRSMRLPFPCVSCRSMRGHGRMGRPLEPRKGC